MEETKDKLGILGGMGPQATQILYQWILDRTDAVCDQDHIPTMILSDTKMPDRTNCKFYLAMRMLCMNACCMIVIC